MEILTITRRVLLGLVCFALVVNGVLLVLARRGPAEDDASLINYSLKAYIGSAKTADRLLESFKAQGVSVVSRKEKRTTTKNIGYVLHWELKDPNPSAIQSVSTYFKNNGIPVTGKTEKGFMVNRLFTDRAAANKTAAVINKRLKVSLEVKPYTKEGYATIYCLEISKLDKDSLVRVKKLLKGKTIEIKEKKY